MALKFERLPAQFTPYTSREGMDFLREWVDNGMRVAHEQWGEVITITETAPMPEWNMQPGTVIYADDTIQTRKEPEKCERCGRELTTCANTCDVCGKWLCCGPCSVLLEVEPVMRIQCPECASNRKRFDTESQPR